MWDPSSIGTLSDATEKILCPPFEWCHVNGGTVILQDAAGYGGTRGGCCQVADFALAKYPITNAQYMRFLHVPEGYADPRWWDYSTEAARWRNDHPRPKPTAFDGHDLPRTRVSWFDSMAFCHWLSAELLSLGAVQSGYRLDARDLATWAVRLPTEQEWQRAAVGDTGWPYPWGDNLDEARANYGGHIGQPTGVSEYPLGQSPCGALDMVGNIWEWCLTAWGSGSVDPNGYTYRVIKGGAWNVSNPDHLRAIDRAGNSPRGRLNDGGFRCALAAGAANGENQVGTQGEAGENLAALSE